MKVTMGAATMGNLPQELTSFVGRKHELVEVRRQLAGSRLVTLLGPGGVGKTRLALQVAEGLRRGYDAGMWLVALDQVHDESLVAPAVVRALGLREQAGLEPAAMLGDHLADRRLLLVLDNCEHVVGAVAKLAEGLLRDTSELRILTTSRQPLNVEGEAPHLVSPLTVPEPGRPMRLEQLLQYEGVALFIERATFVVPGFELSGAHQRAVGEICAQLDGLPLAIELAVARLRVLTPEQIRDRLSDRALLTRGTRTAPIRQQTLQACIAWSHDLCTPDERLLWARLSVFAGDFDLQGAEGVCADDRLASGDVLTLIAALVDKSILVTQHDQLGLVGYRMLESLRTYGQDRLVEMGEESIMRRRHRDWYQQLAARFRAEWIGPHQRDWLRRLDRMLPDIWTALEFSLNDSGDAPAAVATITDLQMYLSVNGLHNQARYWMGRALARPGPATPARMEALYFDATRATSLGQMSAVTARVRQAHETAGQLGDPHSRAVATAAAGSLAAASGDLVAAAAHYEDALGVFHAEGDIFWQALTLTTLTLTKVLLDDLTGAMAGHEAMLKICQPRGDCWFSGFTALSLGIGLWKRGDPDAAATQVTQSLQLIRRTGAPLGTSWALEVTAWIAAARDEFRRAAVLLGSAAALADMMGTRAAHWPDLLTYHEQCQQRVRRALGEQAFAAAFGHGHALPLPDAVAYASGEPVNPPQPVPSRTLDSHASPLAVLTRREREVATLLTQGLSNKEIAAQLVLSRRTIEGHVENILRKLGCSSRAQVPALLVALTPGTDQGSS